MQYNREEIIKSINETLKQVKTIVETDTIVGKKIITEQGDTIIPISKVALGYVGGGGEYFDVKVKKTEHPFASGCGTGAYIKPMGFLLINASGNVKFIEVEKENGLEKMVEFITNFVENIQEKGEK